MLNCTVLESDCATEYTSGRIYTVVGTPIEIRAAHSVGDGYTETVCVECTNGDQVLTNTISVEQVKDCSSYLTVNEIDVPAIL